MSLHIQKLHNVLPMYFVADAAEFQTPVETQLLCEMVSATSW